MRPLSEYVDEAKVSMQQINDWFIATIRGETDPARIIAISNDRNSRIQRDIFERFDNRRRDEYRQERDVNVLRLTCRAGRGRPFGGVPTDSASGRVRRDDGKWLNVPEENTVSVANDIAGSHGVQVDESLTFVDFNVSCRGVAFEDSSRGHGAHDATLNAVFRYTGDAIEAAVADERRALQREVGT